MNDRRLKSLRIPADTVVAFIRALSERPKGVLLPTIVIPEGFRVVSCYIALGSLTLDVVIHHESFPVVPEGDYPPDIGRTDVMVYYPLATSKELAARQVEVSIGGI